jgi:hypothetical protein
VEISPEDPKFSWLYNTTDIPLNNVSNLVLKHTLNDRIVVIGVKITSVGSSADLQSIEWGDLSAGQRLLDRFQ